jgi:hypothetical protein
MNARVKACKKVKFPLYLLLSEHPAAVSCLLFSLVGLLGCLLLLVLLARVPRQWLLEDLQNLLIRDLLVRLDLLQIQCWRSSQLGDAILCDSYINWLALSVAVLAATLGLHLPMVVR